MKNWEKAMRPHKVGEVSSKYGLNPQQFTIDVEQSHQRHEQLWSKFLDFMVSSNVDPQEFRQLFRRYYERFVG